jgi:hypothetical protein
VVIGIQALPDELKWIVQKNAAAARKDKKSAAPDRLSIGDPASAVDQRCGAMSHAGLRRPFAHQFVNRCAPYNRTAVLPEGATRAGIATAYSYRDLSTH